jgi:hypothetical protein
MASNITREEYDYIKHKLERHSPTQVHRKLPKRQYRGITTIRQIQKSTSWKDYTKTYWKKTKPKPRFKQKTYYTWTASPVIDMTKRPSFWEKVKGLFR